MCEIDGGTNRPLALNLKPNRTLRTPVPSADGAGFEPADPHGPSGFGADAFDHSANHP